MGRDPRRPAGYALPRLAPARVWVIYGAAGVLAALALVMARLRVERTRVARWRRAPVGEHRGDGWVAFEDDTSPPLHIASARELAAGKVRVLGLGDGTAGGAYRPAVALSSSGAIAVDLASIERASRERGAATLAVFALVAVLATTPVGAGLFMLLRD